MREQGVISKRVRLAVAVPLVCLLPLACSGDTPDDGVGEAPADTATDATDDGASGAARLAPTIDATGGGLIADSGHADSIAALLGLLPADTRGVVAVDVGSLVSGGSDVDAWLAGEGVDPALGELFGAVGALAAAVDVPRAMASALLAQTTDASDGLFLLAGLRAGTIDEVVAGPVPAPDGTCGPASVPLYEDPNGHRLALLPGGVLVAIDRQVDNALGVGHIYTTGSFDLATGTGTQTVVDCQGPALLCGDIQNGSTAFYTAQELDASDPAAISWRVDVVVDLGGSFGIADSASTFTASRLG